MFQYIFNLIYNFFYNNFYIPIKLSLNINKNNITKIDDFILIDKLSNFIIYYNGKWYSKQKYLPFINKEINISNNIISNNINELIKDFSIIIKWLKIRNYNIELFEQKSIFENILKYRNINFIFTIHEINYIDILFIKYQKKYNYLYKLSREIDINLKNIKKIMDKIEDISLYNKFICHKKANIIFN